jgi:hypothetical protein
MTVKRLDENPKTTDTVLIEIETPDADGCLLVDPYRVDNVKIYEVTRNFAGPLAKTFEKTVLDPEKDAEAVAAEQTACAAPSDDNIRIARQLRAEADATAVINNFAYNNAEAVKVFGTDERPAWLSGQPEVDNLITLVPEDEDGNPQFGHFEVEWNPEFARGGDYFVCWTWTPVAAGSTLSNHIQFTLLSDTAATTSIPTHRTDPDKYPTLLERYLPNMYKKIICDGDLTPETLNRLNLATADGFAFLEDFANQIIDLVDANALHESLLRLLSNFFNLDLKSDDVTLWRRQIKTAVPLFKKKGTLASLEEALAQAGITLTKFTPLWQVVSPYTYCEAFIVEEGQTTFDLTKIPIDVPVSDLENFELFIRLAGSEEFIELTPDFVSFLVGPIPACPTVGTATMTWIGDQLSVNPIILETGDVVKVVYKIAEVPGPSEQIIENFIRTLDLADQRDVLDQTFPLKNWNVRVIEEDDPFFDLVIPTRHPFADLVVFGKIRTEFPYSENIYNMEEYNGSTRDSTNPCDIGREFLDECTACRSSKFIIDLEIENLTDDRITEAQEVIDEYTPFHAVLHRMNFSGAVNEFINPAVEEVEMLVHFVVDENVISGSAQTIFNRAIDNPPSGGSPMWQPVLLGMGPTDSQIFRDTLAEQVLAASAAGDTAFNEDIVLFSPNVKFDALGIDFDLGSPAGRPPFISDHVLEILSPHTHSGVFFDSLSNPGPNLIAVSGISEPLDTSSLTFRISNQVYDNTSATIVKDNLYFLSDEEVDFAEIGVKSDWDVDNDPEYTGGPWEVVISDPGTHTGSFTVREVLPDGSLILNDPTFALPSSNASVTYSLKDDTGTTIEVSDDGVFTFTLRGRVELSDGSITGIRTYVDIGDFMAYPLASDPLKQFEVTGFVEGEDQQFYVASDSDLDATLSPSVGGVTIGVLRRLASEIGNLAYRGLKLVTAVDYEASLGILNGENPPVAETDIVESNKFIENHLVEITTDPGGPEESEAFYNITEWDGTELTLNGPFSDFTIAGTTVDIRIYQFVKTPDVEVPASDTVAAQTGHTFDFIDRRGKEIIDITTETATPMFPMSAFASALNAEAKDQVLETITASESITMSIEYADEGE